MAVLDFLADEVADNVAKRLPIDEGLVSSYVGRLKRAASNKHALDEIFDQMTNDRSLKAGEAIEVAARYAGGRKPTSKSAAMTAIFKQIVYCVASEAKALQVAKMRPL
jgi:hypothetical protein